MPGLRSRGPTALSACSSSRLGRLRWSSSSGAGNAAGSTHRLNDVGLIASLRRKCRLDVLDCRLKLLVRQLLDQVVVRSGPW